MAHTVESQDAAFALLADPATHDGTPVRRIDTHAAVVFLAGDRVLKIKRAVRFPFLDYSTIDKRREACEAELAVNRRYAPMIYRGVLPITREADGRLALAGSGAPVDWVVEMRRFDENATLDHLAAAGRIDTALADALGRAVAAAHASIPAVEPAPWIAALASYIEENADAFRETPDLFPADEADALGEACRVAFRRVEPLLAARGRAGLIRNIHGDLHLGNIALIDGAPVLFDAIEFNPLIASGDVLYDLAFLLMDLSERGLQPAASTVFNRYLAQTRRDEDLDGLAALPLFLTIRAAIRSKVTAALLEHAKPERKDEIRRKAASYFRLAQKLIAPPPAMLVAIGGLSGTGKSQLARALAPQLGAAPGAVWLRTDVERKALFGRAETEPLPPEAYAKSVTAQIYDTVAGKARRIVAAGHSAIADAVYARPDERAAVAADARTAGVSFRGLFLAAPLETRVARVGSRAGDASDADAAIARQQESYALGAIDWTLVDASGTPDQTLARAEAALRGERTTL